MSDLVVRLFPSDQFGCGFSRMLEPARCVLEQTTGVEIQYVFNQEDEGGFEVMLAGRMGQEKVVSVADPECDIVVMQRPAHRHVIETIPHLQAWGCAVVCEYDDDFNSIDPRHAAYLAYEPRHNPMINKLWAQLGSQLADLVTVTTPSLAKTYGSHGRCKVLPNCVPESYLSVKPRWEDDGYFTEHYPTTPRIGWAGNPNAHPGDLEVMGDAIANLYYQDKAILRTVGSGRTFNILDLEEGDGEGLEWASLEDFPALVASFDVGVVPLRDSRFNRAKSWLKGLEYAALGVPFVASPTAEYRKLVQLGAGDLVSTTTRSTAAWERALLRYVEDPEYAALRSEEGRIVASQWTYEKHAERWLQAWRDALSMRRAR